MTSHPAQADNLAIAKVCLHHTAYGVSDHIKF